MKGASMGNIPYMKGKETMNYRVSEMVFVWKTACSRSPREASGGTQKSGYVGGVRERMSS